MAATEELAWLSSSPVAKTLAFLGLQDAAQKRRKPSQTPGAWAGATVTTTNGKVCKSVTQERWEKLQGCIQWIGNAVKPDSSVIHFKALELCVRFIVYVSLWYGSMVPYLKGIYLTLNCWRPGRDEEGWVSQALKEAALGGEKPDIKIFQFGSKLFPDLSRTSWI